MAMLEAELDANDAAHDQAGEPLFIGQCTCTLLRSGLEPASMSAHPAMQRVLITPRQGLNAKGST